MEEYNCPTCERKLEIDYVLRHGSTAPIQYESYCNACRIKWSGNWSDDHKGARLSLWCNMRNVCDEIKKKDDQKIEQARIDEQRRFESMLSDEVAAEAQAEFTGVQG